MRGNPHVAFDEAGAGNVARSRWCDTAQTKGRGNGEYKLRPNPSYSAGLEFELTGVAQGVELA